MGLVVVLGAVISLTLLLLAHLSVLKQSWTERGQVKDCSHRVSILKPLKGADVGLAENIEAILLQRHKEFEVVFGVAEVSDPALEVIKEVTRRHPKVPVKIVVGDGASGLNPKVRLLRSMLVSASHEWVLISDSNVRPGPDYLSRMLFRQEETGASLVHSRLTALQGASPGGWLEELHLATWVCLSISFASQFGHPCVIGKSILMRHAALQAELDDPDIHDVLAEDYMLGTRARERGETVALCADALPVVTAKAPLSAYFNRHIRWGQMRRWIAPAWFSAELLVNPAPLLLVSVALTEGSLRLFLLAMLSIKWLGDAFLYYGQTRQPRAWLPLLLPMRDLSMLFMWAVSWARTSIVWRGNRMRITHGSRLLPEVREQRAAPLRSTSPAVEPCVIAANTAFSQRLHEDHRPQIIGR